MALVFPYIWIPSGGGQVEIVTWADGTDEQIKVMIDAADAGEINLSDYWAVGDVRVMHLSAQPKSNAFINGITDQYTAIALMDTGANSGYKDVNDKPVNFVWGQKYLLKDAARLVYKSEYGLYGTYYTWAGCYLDNDLNELYYNSLPAKFRECLKKFNVVTADLSDTSNITIKTNQNYISIFAGKEIVGDTGNCYEIENNALNQIEYFKTTVNRRLTPVQHYDTQYRFEWLLRSPSNISSDNSEFTHNSCYIYSYGPGISNDRVGYSKYIAPFGCI